LIPAEINTVLSTIIRDKKEKKKLQSKGKVSERSPDTTKQHKQGTQKASNPNRDIWAMQGEEGSMIGEMK
jgi:hypothetical protein